jgi:TonB family protein
MTIDQVRGCLRTGILALFLLASPAGAAFHQQQETGEQFIERMKSKMANAERGVGGSRPRRFLSSKPDSAEAHFRAAQVYAREGARSTAIEFVEKAIEKQFIFPEAHFLLARCLHEARLHVKAREEIHTAIAQGIRIFPAYCLLVEVDIAENKLEAAVSSIEAALGVSEIGDEKEATILRGQLANALETIENLKRLAVLEAAQTAPGIVRPVLLNSAVPRHSDEARNLKIQGEVSMAILVTENGDVSSVMMLRKLGHGLDEEAKSTARNLKFTPAIRNGKPIQYWIKLSVSFKLV